MENAKSNVRVAFTLVLGNSFQELQQSEAISASHTKIIYFYFQKITILRENPY